MKQNDTRERLLDAAFLEVYKNGYHGTGTAAILKEAGVPKGSMYHFFGSKKELVLAVCRERIFPKMEAFFDFVQLPGEDVFQSLERIFGEMADNAALITNGCPMHRLMVEMAPLDEGFETLLSDEFHRFSDRLAVLLQRAVEQGELAPFDTRAMARFFITAIWGEISLAPSLSSRDAFSRHIENLMTLLSHYRRQ